MHSFPNLIRDATGTPRGVPRRQLLLSKQCGRRFQRRIDVVLLEGLLLRLIGLHDLESVGYGGDHIGVAFLHAHPDLVAACQHEAADVKLRVLFRETHTSARAVNKNTSRMPAKQSAARSAYAGPQ